VGERGRERERESRKDEEGNHNRITNAKGFTITECKEICNKLKKINNKKAQA
jgi:hypothetical protein